MTKLGKAFTVKKTFSRTTRIKIQIDAPAEIVWKLLTDTDNYTSWNSTIISINGTIKKGNTIQLVSSLDPSRSFKLKIKEAIPFERLIWGDFMGQRTFTLELTDGGTLFSMSEKIGGPLFPLFANKIPSFDKSFEQFATDLKRTAES